MDVRGFFITLAISLLCVTLWAKDNATDRTFLLEGVREIAAPGAPGPLCISGKDAFAVVAGKTGDVLEPVVAAAKIGSGRVVIFGHDGYFGAETLKTADTGRLMANAVRWAGDKSIPAAARIAVLDSPELLAFLQQKGFGAQSLNRFKWAENLSDYDVLCLSPFNMNDSEIASLQSFVQSGGGLIVSGLGWGWLQLSSGKTLQSLPGNRLIEPFGVMWADGVLERTSKNGYLANAEHLDLCNAHRALPFVLDYTAETDGVSPEQLAQAAWIVSRAVLTLPTSDKAILPKLNTLLAKHESELIPTKEKPLTSKEPLAKLLLAMQLNRMMNTPANEVMAHPAASAFPGSCPTDENKTERKIAVDTSVPDWHSTGIYAAPGEHLEFLTPSTAIGKGMRVRIGLYRGTGKLQRGNR